MSLLIDETGALKDPFTRIESAEDLIAAKGPLLVPVELLAEALEGRRNERLGLSVANRTPVETIEPHLSAFELIAVTFPSFTDGRGLSLARRLRRAGFTGRLRASGPLIADQFAEAIACGFDEVELPDASAVRQPAEQWLAAKNSISAHYQSGYGETRSILQQRLAALKG